MIKAIAAINNKMFLGRDGKMMWKSSEDFKHFKKMTMGGILIVGRKTFEIDLGGKTLPGRWKCQLSQRSGGRAVGAGIPGLLCFFERRRDVQC